MLSLEMGAHPVMLLIRVDFPDPAGPSRTKMSGSSTSFSMFIGTSITFRNLRGLLPEFCDKEVEE